MNRILDIYTKHVNLPQSSSSVAYYSDDTIEPTVCLELHYRISNPIISAYIPKVEKCDYSYTTLRIPPNSIPDSEIIGHLLKQALFQHNRITKKGIWNNSLYLPSSIRNLYFSKSRGEVQSLLGVKIVDVNNEDNKLLSTLCGLGFIAIFCFES
jgi:hypothetical protein